MKKTYVAPETKVVFLNSATMLCASLQEGGLPEEGPNDAGSKSYSGLLWEDDTEE